MGRFPWLGDLLRGTEKDKEWFVALESCLVATRHVRYCGRLKLAV